MDSILGTVKQMIGYEQDYTFFDEDLVVLINSDIRKLNQLGVGNARFVITGMDETWSDYLGDRMDLYPGVKSHLYISAKLIHDPPSNSFTITNYKEELKELEFRIQVDSETPPEEWRN